MENNATFAVEKEHGLTTPFKNADKPHDLRTVPNHTTETADNKQFFISEVQHHYNLRTPKGVRPTTVFFIVTVNGKQVKHSTGLRIYPRQWNSEQNRANVGCTIPLLEQRNNRLLNEKISLLDSRFSDFKRYVNDGVLPFNKETLKNYLSTGNIDMAKKKQVTEKTPLDVATVLLSYLHKDLSVRDSTKGNYERFIKKFGGYMKTQTIYDYNDISLDIMKGFQKWLVETVKGREGERASGQSINKIVDCVIKFLKKYLVNEGLMTGSQWYNIQIEPLKEVNIDDEIALRDDELTLLYNYKCHDKRDEEIKDLFLLECTTGQRFSDTEKVDDLIEIKDGRTYINLVQDKGGAKVEVDIYFSMALDILKKYGYKLPTYNRKIFNKRIKEIAKDAGITGVELLRSQQAEIAGIKTTEKQRYDCISSHTGRRTFITLLSLRGMSVTDIKKYSGHQSDAMVYRYDKSKNGTKLKTQFERLRKERPELILKSVDEVENGIPQHNTSTALNIDKVIQLAKENEKQNREIEELKRGISESNKQVDEVKKSIVTKVKQTEHNAVIAKQIVETKLQAEKDKNQLLTNMVKLGYSYEEYLDILESYGIDTEVLKTDLLKGDTLLD